MPVEIELKLRAETEEPLDALSTRGRLGEATLGEARTFDEVDQYLDTSDGRLSAARWACRLRTRGDSVIASLKGPASAPVGSDGLHRRPEVEGPATGDLDAAVWPPSPARDMVLRLSGGGPLHEILRLRQRRSQRSVALDGRTIGTLSLDRVRIERSRRTVGSLFVVELELADVEPRMVTGPGAALAAVPGLRPDRQTKLEHALALLSVSRRAEDAG